MESGIYLIKNNVNGKVYVGSAINFKNRWSQHKCSLKKNKHHSIKLQRSVNKHGLNSFEFFPIQFCNKEELVMNEQFWISYFNSYNKGYNCDPTAGSPLGRKTNSRSEEHKMKISKANKGRKQSVETLQKKREKALGRKHSEETKNKIKQKSLLHRHSDETKQKISEKQKQYWNNKKNNI